jgi:Bacterial tandem repeat domain 1
MAARSVRVTFQNKAGRFNLRRTAMTLDHGEWTTEPPLLMGDRGEWASESAGFATGTEGRVTYQIEDDVGNRVGELGLHWDNPFVGSNSYDESVAPRATSPIDQGFSVVHVGGGGNDANVTFMLLSGFCSADSETGEVFCTSAEPLSDDRARYAAIFEQATGSPWHAMHGLTGDGYQQRFDQLTSQGFRPVQVNGYAVGGEDRYAAIFELREGPPFAAHHRLDGDQYQQRFDELTSQGFRPVVVSGYNVGGNDRYAAIFEQREGPGFAAHHRLTSDEYQQRFDELTRQGFRLRHVSGYSVG